MFDKNVGVQYEQLGRRIAHGITSDVYEAPADTVVKLLASHIPPGWADREARMTDAVHESGLPAPAVVDLVVLDDRPGIVFERIPGGSM